MQSHNVHFDGPKSSVISTTWYMYSVEIIINNIFILKSTISFFFTI